MAKLKDYVELVANNIDCAILKVRPDTEMGMISLGYFDGTETLLRLTKGKQKTCTIFYKNGNHFSWEWGNIRSTLVSDSIKKAGRLIEECLSMDFDINMTERIEETLYITDYNSSIGKKQNFSIVYKDWNSPVTLLRTGIYLTTFKNYEEAENYLYKILEDIDNEGSGFSETRAEVRVFSGIRKKVS